MRMMALLLATMATLSPSVSGMRGDDTWKDALKEKLLEGVSITKTGIDRLRITDPGTVFVIQKDGVAGNLASDMTIQQVTIKDGEVQQMKGFMASISGKKTNRDFKVGEKVYLIKLEVKDDALRYSVISHDTYEAIKDGTSQQTRYKAVIDFKMDKATLPTSDAATLKPLVAAVLLEESAAEAAKTIELGQTVEQVEKILGKPSRVVKLGDKVTYFYPDMKVIFVEGKVADVQ
jgi:hypothetical protein